MQLGASDDTECVLFESRRAGCWGAYRGEGNRAGNTLRMLEGLEEVVEISDGRNTKHLCARRSDDEIWCWGNNTYGQLGDGSRDLERCAGARARAVAARGCPHQAGCSIDQRARCAPCPAYGNATDSSAHCSVCLLARRLCGCAWSSTGRRLSE